MTAEVAVMNRGAVALAADSAVTLGASSQPGSKNLKIYYTANKLFSLSKLQPVGIMIYGNADLVPFPWETLIKEFRRRLGGTSFPLISEYGDHFIKFLSDKSIFDTQTQELYFNTSVHSIYRNIKSDIDEAVQAQIQQKNGVTEADVIILAKKTIAETFDSWSKVAFLKGRSKGDVSRLARTHRAAIEQFIRQVFQKLPLDAQDKKALQEMAALIFLKDRFKRDTSGVVIAGFGTKELFPGLAVFQIEGIVQDKPKYKLLDLERINAKNGALIYPFAQKEMVSTFIEGIDPEISRYVKAYIQEILDKYPEKLINNIPCDSDEQRAQVLSAMKKAGESMLKQFSDEFTKYIHTTHVSPIIDIVGSLPKNELAEMAEALVNLTSIKRRMSSDAETVGGPVDVALISKGDGLIWVKRKHYFKPELNQHFFAKYFEAGSRGVIT